MEGVPVDTRHWIGGQRVASARTFTDISPIDEQPLAEVAAGGAAEADQAVAAAQQAFPALGGACPATSAPTSCTASPTASTSAPRNSPVVETRDNGSLLRSHRRSVMPRVGMNFRFFADMLRGLSHPDREIRGHRERITWDPAGVTAVITPWNAPLMLATWRIGPALAAGNTVVAKPPEWAPLTASLLADITAEAGLPAGVFNVVQGLGARGGRRAERAPGHPPDVLHRIGAHGRAHRRRRRRPTSCRCRSSSAASPRCSSSPTPTSTWRCAWPSSSSTTPARSAWAPSASWSQESIAGRFPRGRPGKARAVVQGDPRDPATDISCLVSRPHFERVDGFVRRALAAGATAALGGGPNRDLGGLYYQPTILTPVPAGQRRS